MKLTLILLCLFSLKTSFSCNKADVKTEPTKPPEARIQLVDTTPVSREELKLAETTTEAIRQWKVASEFDIPADFCVLPPEVGFEGRTMFVEDCRTLNEFTQLPMPGHPEAKYGVHPMVCCPIHVNVTDECHTTVVDGRQKDPFCEDYEWIAFDEDDEIEGETKEPPIYVTEFPVMSEMSCSVDGFNDNYPCVNLHQCSDIYNGTDAPKHLIVCGWDEVVSTVMVCCSEKRIKRQDDSPAPPRFVGYGCRDKHDLCSRWVEHDGCSLDKDFVISEKDIWNGRITSRSMFDFMTGTCMESCRRCGDKGCRDEVELCQAWARAGMCVINPMLMTHTCRESCGVCGFLSPSDNTEQVVGDNSYSHFWNQNFDCGRYKSLVDVTAKPPKKSRRTRSASGNRRATSKVKASEKDEIWSFSFSGAASEGQAYCGATLISDRWVVTAAHCHDEVENEKPKEDKFGPRKVKINTIRDNTPYKEIIEIKRVVMHPYYKYPSQYNDIALLELGRRVEYNWDVYGDSPVCMDTGAVDLVGREAKVQGYGENEEGKRGVLMEAKVKVVSNEDCQKMLDYNATDNHIARRQLNKTLPMGLNDQLLCSQGYFNEETGVVSGPCKGDDGGPMNVKLRGRTTVAGIVSGGIGCGKGYPSWYTRLSFYANWVECVIGKSRKKSRSWVERECSKLAKHGNVQNVV